MKDILFQKSTNKTWKAKRDFYELIKIVVPSQDQGSINLVFDQLSNSSMISSNVWLIWSDGMFSYLLQCKNFEVA